MLKGLITSAGELVEKADALRIAAEEGQCEGWPLGVLVHLFNDYPRTKPSASMVAADSWRQYVLQAVVPFYAYPDSRYPLLRGTLVHKGLERGKFPKGVRVVNERRLKASLPNYPEIEISGQIDVYYPAAERLEDYKTCTRIPDTIKPSHMLQLATYAWLLKMHNSPVSSVAIDYVSWKTARQVSVTKVAGSVVPAVEHPWIQDIEAFEDEYAFGYQVLAAGLQDYIIPSMRFCNTQWCRNCTVKWACDRIDVEGEKINPKDFVQGG